MEKKLLIFVALIISNSVFAQNWRDYYGEIYKLDSVLSEKQYVNNFFLEADIYGFIKNNEYFNDFKDGQTFIGVNNKIKFKYYASNRLNVSAGVYIHKYFGEKKLNPISPIFKIDFKINEKLNLVFGSIEGNHQHKFDECLYSFDNYITDLQENGIQLKYKSKYVFSDNFINWISYIEHNSPFQEEILFGSSNSFNFKYKKFEFHFPLQFMLYHRGGQINMIDTFIHTSINGNVGVSIYRKLSTTNSSIYIGFNYLSFNDISPKKQIGLTSGNAYKIKAGINLNYFNFELAYFNGNKFYSVFGEDIFHSISNKNPGFVENNRKLINSSLRINIITDDYLRLLLGGFVYYDIVKQTNDYSLSLDLIYNLKRQI